jgi:hypothetical protein
MKPAHDQKHTMSRIFPFRLQKLTLLKSAVIFGPSFAAFATPACATTKGLSQIVTAKPCFLEHKHSNGRAEHDDRGKAYDCSP